MKLFSLIRKLGAKMMRNGDTHFVHVWFSLNVQSILDWNTCSYNHLVLLVWDSGWSTLKFKFEIMSMILVGEKQGKKDLLEDMEWRFEHVLGESWPKHLGKWGVILLWISYCTAGTVAAPIRGLLSSNPLSPTHRPGIGSIARTRFSLFVGCKWALASLSAGQAITALTTHK